MLDIRSDIEVTESMKGFCEKKLSKIKKYMGSDGTIIVHIKKEGKNNFSIGISCEGYFLKKKYTEGSGDFYNTFNSIVNKIKTILSEDKRISKDSIRKDYNTSSSERAIEKTVVLNEKISLEEAVEKLNSKSKKRNFYVYLSENGEICIVYKNNDEDVVKKMIIN